MIAKDIHEKTTNITLEPYFVVLIPETFNDSVYAGPWNP